MSSNGDLLMIKYFNGTLGVVVPLGAAIRHPDSTKIRVVELVASTNDPFVDLIIGGYITARKFAIKSSNGFHRGCVTDDSTAELGILKNGIQVGTISLSSNIMEISISNIDSEVVFDFNDVLQLKILNLSNTCYFIAITLMGEFYPYNLADILE